MSPPEHRWSFLRPRWLGTGIMLSGGLDALYGFVNCVRYWRFGEIRPLWFGQSPMAFSTAAIPGVVIGLAMFWVGWFIRDSAKAHEPAEKKSIPAHMVPVLCAVISAISLIVVTLIGTLKH